MAQEERVFLCDHCRRVVATLNTDGTLTIRARHDAQTHETRVRPLVAVPVMPER